MYSFHILRAGNVTKVIFRKGDIFLYCKLIQTFEGNTIPSWDIPQTSIHDDYDILFITRRLLFLLSPWQALHLLIHYASTCN